MRAQRGRAHWRSQWRLPTSLQFIFSYTSFSNVICFPILDFYCISLITWSWNTHIYIWSITSSSTPPPPSPTQTLLLGEQIDAVLDPLQTRTDFHFLPRWPSLHGWFICFALINHPSLISHICYLYLHSSSWRAARHHHDHHDHHSRLSDIAFWVGSLLSISRVVMSWK